MRRVSQIALVVLLAIGLLYISRFWPFELWTRQSVLGQWGFRPRGGLLQTWLRGTPLAPFELLVWAVLAFVSLTLAEKLSGFLAGRPKE